MDKIDFKKEFKQFYSPKTGKPEIVDMPPMQLAMVDGKGDPNKAKEFEEAVGALYSVVYGLKFGRKRRAKLQILVPEHSKACGGVMSVNRL